MPKPLYYSCGKCFQGNVQLIRTMYGRREAGGERRLLGTDRQEELLASANVEEAKETLSVILFCYWCSRGKKGNH